MVSIYSYIIAFLVSMSGAFSFFNPQKSNSQSTIALSTTIDNLDQKTEAASVEIQEAIELSNSFKNLD